MLMRVTLAQLEALRAVVHYGSVTRAAKALRVTQPAVSQQIAGLQRALQLTLVETVHNRPRLTEAGRFVAERVESIVAASGALLREAREYASGERGVLHLAATLTIGTYVLPELLAVFYALRPQVRPDVRIVNTVAVAAMVREGTVSIGLVEGVVEGDLLEREPFARDRLVLIVPARAHRFSTADEIDASELHAQSFVSRELGSGTRDLGYGALRARGVEPHITVELPSGEALVHAVGSGLGVAIVSELTARSAVALGEVRIVTIRDLRMERAFEIIRLRGQSLSPLAQTFASLVRERGLLRGEISEHG